jgi:hypothetical protein
MRTAGWSSLVTRVHILRGRDCRPHSDRLIPSKDLERAVLEMCQEPTARIMAGSRSENKSTGAPQNPGAFRTILETDGGSCYFLLAAFFLAGFLAVFFFAAISILLLE